MSKTVSRDSALWPYTLSSRLTVLSEVVEVVVDSVVSTVQDNIPNSSTQFCAESL